jgi:hypothetical protein
MKTITPPMMKPKTVLCLALVLGCGFRDSFADGVGTSDGFQLEIEIHIVEQAALDALSPVASWTNGVPWFAMDNAIGEIDRHYSLWSTNTSIPPRLSKAVLTIFPSLTNISMPGPQPGNQMWCNAVSMLAGSHDLAMIAVLRPFLKNKVVAGDGSYWFEDKTPLRACDKAAIAISLLLGDKNFADGGFAISGAGIRNVRDSYRKWDEWDKKIGELEKRLDELPKK